MAQKEKNSKEEIQKHLPDADELTRELGKAKSIDDFYGKGGIFARLFSQTVEKMLETELTEKLGYEPYQAEGRNSGNSRNGHYGRKMRTSGGDTEIQVPRDRNGEFHSELLKKNSNEIEQKVIAMYAIGRSVAESAVGASIRCCVSGCAAHQAEKRRENRKCGGLQCAGGQFGGEKGHIRALDWGRRGRSQFLAVGYQ